MEINQIHTKTNLRYAHAHTDVHYKKKKLLANDIAAKESSPPPPLITKVALLSRDVARKQDSSV